jgi:threonylcarbamoyladenosine tRNA methylthiotransferase MtaB
MHGFTENYVRVEHEYQPDWVNTCRPMTLGHEIHEGSQGPAVTIPE